METHKTRIPIGFQRNMYKLHKWTTAFWQRYRDDNDILLVVLRLESDGRRREVVGRGLDGVQGRQMEEGGRRISNNDADPKKEGPVTISTLLPLMMPTMVHRRRSACMVVAGLLLVAAVAFITQHQGGPWSVWPVSHRKPPRPPGRADLVDNHHGTHSPVHNSTSKTKLMLIQKKETRVLSRSSRSSSNNLIRLNLV